MFVRDLRYSPFGLPRFWAFLRTVLRREPPKPGTRTPPVALGFLFFLVIFSPAVLTAVIFPGITTTPPSIVSAEGVTGGGGAVSSRKTILWNEVIRVDCKMRSNQWVTTLRIVAASKTVELSGGGNLVSVRDYIWSQVPDRVVHHCSRR